MDQLERKEMHLLVGKGKKDPSIAVSDNTSVAPRLEKVKKTVPTQVQGGSAGTGGSGGSNRTNHYTFWWA